MTARFRIGTYANGGGAGLCTLQLGEDGGWTVGAADDGVPNASFGTHSARHGLYYFVDEQLVGAVGVYRPGANGLVPVARVATLGIDPCYIALDRDESLLAIANYGSGSIVVFRLDSESGLPLEHPALRENLGSGPVSERQEGPHAHCACFSPDDRWLFHVDLGTDQILSYPLNPRTRALGERKIAFAAPPGSGPRHLVFHPILPLALLASELASTLIVLQVAGGRLIPRETMSTLPSGYGGANICGHLSLNAAGDRAYVTNRGHDSVGVYSWNEAGILAPLQHVPSGGPSPRAFVLLEAERQMLLANEQDGTVTPFALQANGTLSAAGAPISVPGAAFPFVMAH
ncbi:lactonase family protein [Sphingomonas endolithica]|uniref:lactonase family protein n=1 Tax=Sphingomonas endolithica TaxID=2972485 RepID=UPI0021AE66E9|nr:lactonase family protein [Sphingomonas sp. ZFBP2030]